MSGIRIVEAFERERTSVMKEPLTMSYQETERLKVISRVEHKELTVVEAAESLSLSERHLYRILHRYRDEGEGGLIHRLRGRASNVAFEAETRKEVLRLYQERYSDYGPTLFGEKLESVHGITISRPAITRWLAQASLWGGELGRNDRIAKNEHDEPASAHSFNLMEATTIGSKDEAPSVVSW